MRHRHGLQYLYGQVYSPVTSTMIVVLAPFGDPSNSTSSWTPLDPDYLIVSSLLPQLHEICNEPLVCFQP